MPSSARSLTRIWPRSSPRSVSSPLTVSNSAETSAGIRKPVVAVRFVGTTTGHPAWAVEGATTTRRGSAGQVTRYQSCSKVQRVFIGSSVCQ